MGGCASVPIILEKTDGDQAAYSARFVEDRVLGQGEFGQVKLIHEKDTSGQESAPSKSYACKVLRKGAVFKDNTLYPPIPPEVLQVEIDILRTLNGNNYCMKLVAIYETPKALLMVTDCYLGGEMMEYISKQKEDLRTEDISRISFQLLSAVDHCAKNQIIHRDIKPENVMFESEAAGAELRLIDFGCSTNKVVEDLHTTFAGTPFYNSPEMFQKTYSSKTDVWSAGVLIYVLVAGYPSENLQKSFNKLLDAKRKSTKELINIPQDLPEPFYELLDQLLFYRHKQRKSAGEVLDADFVVFHKDLKEEGTAEKDEEEEAEENNEEDKVMELAKPSPRRSRMSRTASMALIGSVRRHSAFLDFKKFERSLTTCLATMLNRDELIKLLAILDERFGKEENSHLEVVVVRQLKDIIKLELNNSACVGIIEGVDNSASYDNFAYHVELLREFAPKQDGEEQIKSNGAPADRGNNKLQKNASVWQMSSAKKSMTTETNDAEDSFNIAGSLHGRLPSSNLSLSSNNMSGRKSGAMARAKSCAINI